MTQNKPEKARVTVENIQEVLGRLPPDEVSPQDELVLRTAFSDYERDLSSAQSRITDLADLLADFEEQAVAEKRGKTRDSYEQGKADAFRVAALTARQYSVLGELNAK